MTKAPVTQQSGDLVTVDIMEDFGRFPKSHTADGDASLATIRSYYGNAAQFVEAARPDGELHLKFGNVLRAFRPVGV